MVISSVKIVWISDHKGYGLIATHPIPKGTITFAQDGLDIVIPSEKLESVDQNLREYVEKYSYEDFLGNRVVSWDLGKYMNHDDEANTLSTGYGFEIAIRDIAVGEEVTDDYRIFSTHHDTSFASTQEAKNEPELWSDEQVEIWDKKVQMALKSINLVNQPLRPFIQNEIWDEVLSFSHENYRSVKEAFPLRYNLQTLGLLSEGKK